MQNVAPTLPMIMLEETEITAMQTIQNRFKPLLKLPGAFVAFPAVWSKLLRAFLACVTAVASLHPSFSRKSSGTNLLWVIQSFSDFVQLLFLSHGNSTNSFIAADLKL